jgi:effector-binding domain-containing protein
MAYDVQVKEVPDELVASIRSHVSMATIGDEIGRAFSRLAEVIDPVGYGDGPPGLITHEIDPSAGAEIEVFMPVRERFDPPTGIEVKTLEGGPIAAAVHRGPYDQVGSVYEAIAAWVPEHERDFAGPPRERYLNDPVEPGQGDALTEVQFPIR